MFRIRPLALAAALSLVLYACNARPVDRSIQRNFVSINNYSYEVALLPSIDQDSNSDIYEFLKDPKAPVDPKTNSRYHDIALLKVVKKPRRTDDNYHDDLKMIKEHVSNLKKLDMLVTAAADPKDDRSYFLVIRNIRNGYDGSEELEPFHTWYLLDENMDIDESLFKLRNLVKKKLVEFRDKYNLLYFDFHLLNFYVDEKFTYTMAKNWAPERTKEGNKPEYGVVRLSDNVDENASREKEFSELVEDTLERDFSPEAFISMANAFGPTELPLWRKERERAARMGEARQ